MSLRGEGPVTRCDLKWPPSQERGSPALLSSQHPLLFSHQAQFSSALVRNSSLLNTVGTECFMKLENLPAGTSTSDLADFPKLNFPKDEQVDYPSFSSRLFTFKRSLFCIMKGYLFVFITKSHSEAQADLKLEVISPCLILLRTVIYRLEL